MRIKRKLMIIGLGECGKDTVAEIMSKNHGVSYTGSSWAACEGIIYPATAIKYGYKSVQECYDDRRNHREEWKDLICAFNKIQPDKLASLIYEKSDAYIGMRDHREFKETLLNWDPIVIWVDVSRRLPELCDTTMTIDSCDADYILDNNGNLEQLENHIRYIMTCINHYDGGNYD